MIIKFLRHGAFDVVVRFQCVVLEYLGPEGGVSDGIMVDFLVVIQSYSCRSLVAQRADFKRDQFGLESLDQLV